MMRNPRPRGGRDDAEPHRDLSSLLVGFAATLGTIVIHGFVVHAIVMALRRNLQRGLLGVRLWVNLTFIMSATLLALVGHLVEIALWAFALKITGAVPDLSAALYSSGGSYTTSGSDIVLPPQWKLLGPFEAVCGMLMFGVSTAFIFAVIQRLIHARFEDADKFLQARDFSGPFC
ncbi:MAG TPA: two pore domain potassium channel family protein [Roseiarcus sp.]|nr:two pore domain potassium channel family protein [Roseiarcus sp.]